MAKGEGGEQYSNASLLNKTVSSDSIKLARKVRSFIGSEIMKQRGWFLVYVATGRVT